MAEEKGFEPLRRFLDLPVFKTGPFNQTWVFLLNKWCPRPEPNRHELLHSQDFKSCASTYSATKAHLVSRWGFEPQTPWLKVKCSTDWASETKNKFGCLGWIRTSGMQESKSCALPLGYEAILQVVERDGVEPSNPKEQIYSLPRLATSLSLQKNGAENRNRTRNLLITSQLLYQLSYFGKKN